jgi:hypothetical protein
VTRYVSECKATGSTTGRAGKTCCAPKEVTVATSKSTSSSSGVWHETCDVQARQRGKEAVQVRHSLATLPVIRRSDVPLGSSCRIPVREFCGLRRVLCGRAGYGLSEGGRPPMCSVGWTNSLGCRLRKWAGLTVWAGFFLGPHPIYLHRPLKVIQGSMLRARKMHRLYTNSEAY